MSSRWTIVTHRSKYDLKNMYDINNRQFKGFRLMLQILKLKQYFTPRVMNFTNQEQLFAQLNYALSFPIICPVSVVERMVFI